MITNRLIFRTLEEEQILNRAKSGLMKSGDVEARGKLGYFTNATTGAVSDRSGNDINNITPVEEKINKSVAPQDPYEILKETEQAKMTDAQSQIQASYENLRNQNLAAGETATQNIESPLVAGMASRVGTRGDFTAGTNVGITAAIPDAVEKAVQQDPRVLDAMNKLNNASAKMEAARANISTIGQAQAFAELDKAQAVADAVNQQVLAEQEAANASAKANLDFITKNPGALTGASVESAAEMLRNAGLNPAFAPGLIAQAKEAQSLKGVEQAQAMADLQKTLAEIQQVGVEKPSTDMQDFAFYQELQTSNPDAAKRFAEMKGFSDAQIQADLQKKQADINEINSKISETYSGTGGAAIDVGSVGTGSALALNTLGNSSTTLRTDRHNNPTANKAYQTTIDRLTAAGLVQGVDFDVGETTQGIDDDGVPTIMYKDAATGVQGSIVTLKAGEIGSWYANPKYGGSPKIISALSSLSGQNVNSSNAQDVFNGLDTPQQTEVVKSIYSHEGGSQLFKAPRDINKQYKETLKPYFSKTLQGKTLTAGDKEFVFEDLGLSEKEWEQGLANAKFDVNSRAISEFEKLLSFIDVLVIPEGEEAPEGNVSLGRAGRLLSETDTGRFFSSDYADFNSTMKGLTDTLALENLIALKSEGATFGALSDNELNFINNAATRLKAGLSDEMWNQELLRLKTKLQRGLSGATGGVQEAENQGGQIQFDLEAEAAAATPKSPEETKHSDITF